MKQAASRRPPAVVIFDCGRVITHDQNQAIAAEMAAVIGASAADFAEAYAAERGPYDRGVIDAAVYWAKVSARLGSCLPAGAVPRLVELDMDSWFTINTATVDLAGELKALGRKLMILSNMNFEGKERMYGRARVAGGRDWIALFDDILLSCDLGMLKPDRDIYEACVARAGVRAEECVFIDDMPANVEAARACGMGAVHFTDVNRLRASLAREHSLALAGGAS